MSKSERPSIKNNCIANWFAQPHYNLAMAILLQAVADKDGYIQDAKYHDGKEATQFLESTGKKLYDYINATGIRY